jgi:hypothetical protein
MASSTFVSRHQVTISTPRLHHPLEEVRNPSSDLQCLFSDVRFWNSILKAFRGFPSPHDRTLDMASDDPSKNPFIRFKQHVDSRIATTMQGILGLPTVVSRTFGSNWIEGREAGHTPSKEESQRGPESASATGSQDIGDGWLRAFQWADFAVSSAYSPLNLKWLPQPVPKDLPSHVVPGVFTFEDAFEDLLSVCSGKPLMDLNAEYERKILTHTMFPNGVPLWVSLSRWQKAGLLENYDPGVTMRSPHDPDSGCGESEQRKVVTLDTVGQLFDELDRFVKSISTPRYGDESQSHDDVDPQSGTNEEPDTFDELYSTIKSAFADAERPFTAIAKVLRDSASDAQNNHVNRPAEAELKSTKLERVESTEEFADDFGNIHKKRVVCLLDENGDEVGREETYSIHPAERQARPRSAENSEFEGAPERNEQTQAGPERKTGWFWK